MATRRRGWFRYWIVDWIVERTWALMAVLAFACVALVGTVTALVAVVTPDEVDGGGPWHAAWWHLLLTLDPGTIGNDTSEHAAWYRVFTLTATVGGILIVSSLIGVLTAALNDKLQQLRRGRTPTVERSHTVVLGWSEDLDAILDELAETGERRPCAIILDPDPRLPELVEEVITRLLAKVRTDIDNTPADWTVRRRELSRKLVTLRSRLRVVYRIGDPTKIDDLDLVSLESADAVIIPRPVGSNPDVRVLTTLLALSGRPWPKGKRRPPLAAVVTRAGNCKAARDAIAQWSDETGEKAHIVDAETLVARVLVQSLRYPGVSIVIREMLSFEGIEVRLPDESSIEAVRRRLVGKTYGEALHLFEHAGLIGLVRDEGFLVSPFPSGQGEGEPDGGVIRPTDSPIVISYGSGAKDIRVRRQDRKVWWREEHLAPAPPAAAVRAERILMLGWNRRVETILTELPAAVPPGSSLLIVGPDFHDDVLPDELGNLRVSGMAADPSESGVLADLVESGALGDIKEYTRVVVLAEDETVAGVAEDANIDAKALVTLLLLQEVKGEVASRTIICELGDDGNRRLAGIIAADDLVVGQRLVTTLAVQFAKNPHSGPLSYIMERLFHAGDEDVCIEPVRNYVTVDDESVTFADVVEAARRRGQTAIGYRLARERENYYRNYGVHLNPPKDRRVGFIDDDEVVVIARPVPLGGDLVIAAQRQAQAEA